MFNSIEFLIFFPIVLLLYFALPKKAAKMWLLVASYYFYMGWNAKYALLIFFITLVSYAGGLWLCRGPSAVFLVRKKKDGRRADTMSDTGGAAGGRKSAP